MKKNEDVGAKDMQTAAVAAQKSKTESEYSISELAGCARKLFKTSADIAFTALKLAGKDRYTVPEAERIVQEFAKKEVK